MMKRLAFAIVALAMLPMPLMAAETPAAEGALALPGCWEMRDTKAEIARHAEDPYYASSVTYCFDEGGPGQLVTRAAEFSGYRDDAGSWVNGGGDGWEEGSEYEVVGNQIEFANTTSVEICHFTLEADVLMLTDCVIENVPSHSEIEDTSYDRATN